MPHSLCPRPPAIIKERHVDQQQPRAQRPNRITRRRPCQRLQNRTQAQQRSVYQRRRLDRCKAPPRASRTSIRIGAILFRRVRKSHPVVPECPRQNRAQTRPNDDSDGRDASLDDGDEATAKYDHGGKMLHDDCAIRHQRPELVGLKSRVTLQVIEKCGFIRVVVRDCNRQIDLWFSFFKITHKAV
jgi:hypothetical protein